MKATAAWQAIPWLLIAPLALAAKISSKVLLAEMAPDSCVGNVLPPELAAGPHSAIGKATKNPILDITALQAVLKASAFWKIGKIWELKLTASSSRSETSPSPDAMFAFPGGPNGFLHFTVPRGVVDMKINTTSVVNSVAEDTSLEYFSPQADTSDDVVLTNLCLRPKTCEGFTGCVPVTEWKSGSSDTPGWSRGECCVQRMCKDQEDACMPANEWDKVPNFDLQTGSTHDRCCLPKKCPTDVCAKDSKWRPKPGTGHRGTSKEECCEPIFCAEFNCPISTAWGKAHADASAQGSTKEECCFQMQCADFNCSVSEIWTDKKDKADLPGRTFPECCDHLYCEDFECKIPYSPKKAILPDGTKLRGASSKHCCEELYCKDYNCSSEKLKKLENSDAIVGHHDEECCDAKLCEVWTCSSTTKWVPKPTIDDSGKSLEGFSDEECCEPVMCESFDCSPASSWKVLGNATLLKLLQGSTVEECCEPIYCKDYNCSGDHDGDGESTTWYKKVDTNHHRYLGSTDEECCVARRCNQFNTQFPDKFKRKVDKNILGSTDAECYDSRLCIDYCCKAPKKLKPNSQKIEGNSDEACCLSPER
mmetsp:Transcript_44121/g.79335  ORF Transcript_44121/g.79335 Transcript_44121/m.79335 type:complete len:592 (-) Transcript_44121:80-1855(-)